MQQIACIFYLQHNHDRKLLLLGLRSLGVEVEPEACPSQEQASGHAGDSAHKLVGTTEVIWLIESKSTGASSPRQAQRLHAGG